jgi:hypothetical protein
VYTTGHVIAIIHTTGHVIDNYGEDLIQLNHYINTTGSTRISFPTSRTGKYGYNNQLMHNNYSNNNVLHFQWFTYIICTHFHKSFQRDGQQIVQFTL